MTLLAAALGLLVLATAYLIVGLRLPAPSVWFPPRASRRAALVTLAVSLLVLAALATSIFVGIQKDRRRPSRYLIPEGYVGWVRIEFEVKGAAPVPREGESYLFKISNNGLLRTSSAIEYGWAKDEYFYYSGGVRRALATTAWGGGGMIWGGLTGTSSDDSGTSKYMEFYVGTEEQFREPGNDVDRKGQKVIGPRYPLQE